MKTLSSLLVLGLLLMAVPATAHADDAPTTKITVQFKNQEVTKVIETLAKFGKASVIVSPEVTGTISVNFVETPWRTALEVVVKTVGGKLIEEAGGILRVVPAGDAAKAKGIRVLVSKAKAAVEARRSLEVLLVESKKRADELRVKLEKERASHPHKRRVILNPLVVQSKPSTQAAVVLRLYDVRDLKTLHGKPIDVAEIVTGVVKGDGTLNKKPGILVLRGTPDVHERVTRVLTKLRTAQGDRVTIGLGGGAGGKTVYLPRVTKDLRVFVDQLDARTASGPSGSKGRRVVKHKSGDVIIVDGKHTGTWRSVHEGAHGLGAQSFAAQKKRIGNLQQAARYLDAAGDKAGAKRVRAQIAAATQKLKHSEAAAKAGAVHHEVQASIQGLRKDVIALRKDVRELTNLVRRLLKQQQR